MTLTDPEDRPLARAVGLLTSQPRRYAIVTIEQEGRGLRHAIEDIFRESLPARPR